MGSAVADVHIGNLQETEGTAVLTQLILRRLCRIGIRAAAIGRTRSEQAVLVVVRVFRIAWLFNDEAAGAAFYSEAVSGQMPIAVLFAVGAVVAYCETC